MAAPRGEGPRPRRRGWLLLWPVAPCLALLTGFQGPPPPRAGADWPAYGGGAESIRYSPLAQINRDNVRDLRVAWTYESGDAFPGSEMQCNPLVVGGVLYATTPRVAVETAMMMRLCSVKNVPATRNTRLL